MPKLEGCSCGRDRVGPEGDPNALLILLLIIVVFVCILVYRIESHVFLLVQNRQQRDGAHNKEESIHHVKLTVTDAMVAHARARISPSTHASSLLDSGLDDIKVPSLEPLSQIKTLSIVEPSINKTPSIAVPNKTTPASIGISINEAQLPKTVARLLMDQHVDNLPIPVLEPQRVHVKKQPFDDINTPAPVPWDGKIRWALRGCSVFDNIDDEIDALLYRPNLITQESPADLWVFQYGLRYLPAKDERDVYRAITIENLPSDVTMKQVLPLIHGEIYSAHLLDTVPITGYSTAFVTFVSQTDTLSFLKSSGGQLVVGAAQARVTLVPTPTYPMTAAMTRQVRNEGCTRCVCVSGLRETLKREVHRVLGKSPHTHYVERIEDGEVVGEVNIRFHSIKVAIAAHGLLKSHPSFGGCKFRFLKGTRPTARPDIGIWE